MAVRDDFTAGEVLAAADLNDTFASKPPFAYGTATPTTTVEGFIWYDENDTPPTAKFWDGSAFEPFSSGAGDADFSDAATGTYTDGGIDYKFITFNSSGTLTVTTEGFADVLVVGGGGAGGNHPSGVALNFGGGGAGGYISQNIYLPAATHTITVGGGGAAKTLGGSDSALGTLLSSVGGSIGAFDDGYNPQRAGRGGSGGGGCGNNNNSRLGGTGVINQGNNGGNGFNGTGDSAGGGGGGGAGAAGANGTNSAGGNGGNGLASSITGTSVTRAAGGGGSRLSGTGGTGGTGGGGNGQNGGSGSGVTNGTTNRGSGGGGARGADTPGTGGSGVVIIRVRTN